MFTGAMPEFREYREPFIGGGSVFIKTKQLRPDAKYWVNDLYYDLYCFWDETKNNVNALTEMIHTWKRQYESRGKELHSFLCGNLPGFSELERAAAFFILNRITFSGTSLSGGYSQAAFEQRFTETSIRRIEEISSLLRDTEVTNLDYSELMDAPGEDVFIFLDPPYFTATKSALYGRNGELHKGFDHERFAQTARRCRHKWMITYDDCPYIRNLYKDFEIIPFGLVYGMKNVSRDAEMKGKEVLILNYRLNDLFNYQSNE